MNTVCVVLYRLSENDVHRKGILIESNNPYSNETNQIIIDGNSKPISVVISRKLK
jgi:hypothetical protein